MKATHPKIAALAALFAIAVSLAACGDDVTKVTKIEENHDARVVGSLMEASCNGTTGEMVFSREDNQLYVCAAGEWISMKGSDGKDGQSDSASSGNCKTRHVKAVGVEGVVIDCGSTLDTLWSTKVQLCGDSVYDASQRFCDHRDNQIYRWTRIGSQIWMAQNLRFGTAVNATADQGNATVAAAQMYDQGPVFGGLYQWHTAMAFEQAYDKDRVVTVDMIGKPHRGICPEGWHVPDSAEWMALYKVAADTDETWTLNLTRAAQKLKSKNYWRGAAGVGTDDFGFDGLPAGVRYTDGTTSNSYSTISYMDALWWSSTKDGQTAAYAAGLDGDSTRLIFYYGNDRQKGLSIRCINDLSQKISQGGISTIVLPCTIGGISCERLGAGACDYC